MKRTGRIAMFLLVAALAAPAGCTVSELAKGRPGKDLSEIVPGIPRSKVESIVGAPGREWATPSGVRYRLYRYDAGVPPAKADAATFAFFDVLSLGLWEAFSKPGEWLGPPRAAWLGVSYDAQDRVIGVFPDTTEFANLPDDGRRP
ncbi:MAG TPA: hypothetical protein VEG36_01270 [Burkholderiales bacterium]|nr:hypothetical protein [Burkholderiales bacterium]